MQCSECNAELNYFQGEEKAYARADAAAPTNCPQCRRRRHLIFRNEKNLFYNKSFKSGRKIISLYPTSSPFRIIDQDEWWDDSFDATIYGRDFDFNKPFFEQYKELQKQVPRWSRIFVNCENSDYTNNCAEIKNSYLTFSSYKSTDLYYCMRVFRSNSCIDCINVSDSQYCSQCVDCKKCYNLNYSLLSENCSDSLYLYHCKNCRNCIMSSQIRNKEYMVLNKQYSKEEYEKIKEEFLRKLSNNKNEIDSRFKNLIRQSFHKNLNMINSQDCLGNFINDSKNITNGFYVIDSQDCINVYDSSALKNCYDNSYNEKSELCVEIDTSYELYNSKFCTYTITLRDCAYCDQCDHLVDCFGCIGLKKQRNCILNKRYDKASFDKLKTEINEHMKRTGGPDVHRGGELVKQGTEFGKPFPSTLSPFPYNITVAQDFYPLDQAFAAKLGYMWHTEEKEAVYFGQKYEIPEDINAIDESICDKILICEKTGKNYKIIPQELKFYKTFGLPVPRISPDQRYKQLIGLEPSKRLTNAICCFCGAEIETVYPQEYGYKIACEKCYLNAAY